MPTPDHAAATPDFALKTAAAGAAVGVGAAAVAAGGGGRGAGKRNGSAASSTDKVLEVGGGMETAC